MRRRIAAGAVALGLAACGGPRDTPRAAWEEVRRAASGGDPRVYYDVHDEEARARSRRTAADWRARLERGEPEEALREETSGVADGVRDGTLEEAAGRILAKVSPIAARAAWYAAATVAEEGREGEDAARLRLVGKDGASEDLWLSRGADGWGVDPQRTWFRR